MINYTIDIIILIILLLFIFVFAHKGLVESILKSCSWLISLLAAYFLYPIISGLIRQTFIFASLRESVYNIMNLENMTAQNSAGQISAIDSLTLPEGLKNMLVDNNNSVIYELLGADSLQEYIAGYIANIILNIIVSILVFVVIIIIIKASSAALKLAVSLPLVKQIDGLGGGILGLFWGVVFVWMIMSLSTLFIAAPFFADIITAIDSSIIGKLLYDNNFIMNVLMAKLFGWG
ncbi:MAG: CvpA family protein [Clostridia bacterium]|nr:CvpA family protein [Clostridia bacterium]